MFQGADVGEPLPAVGAGINAGVDCGAFQNEGVFQYALLAWKLVCCGYWGGAYAGKPEAPNGVAKGVYEELYVGLNWVPKKGAPGWVCAKLFGQRAAL